MEGKPFCRSAMAFCLMVAGDGKIKILDMVFNGSHKWDDDHRWDGRRWRDDD